MTSVSAQEELLFHHLTRNEGLLHDNVTCIAQDSLGYMWFGTHRGLNRYDGYTIDSYKHEGGQMNSVYYNRIYSISRANRYLWLATAAGLACFDIPTKRFVSFDVRNESDVLFLSKVRYLKSEPHTNRLWLIGENWVRVASIIPSKKSNEKPELNVLLIDGKKEIRTSQVNPKIAFNKDIIWISGENSLSTYRFQNGTYTNISHKENTIGNGVFDMSHHNGFLWILYYNRLVKYHVKDNQRFEFVHQTDLDVNKGIFGLCVSSNNVWVGTTEGLFQINPSTYEVTLHKHIPNNPFSISNDLNYLFLDNTENLWVSAWASGVAHTHTKATFFHTIRYTFNSDTPTKHGSEFVSAMHYGNDGYVYMGSKFAGISRFNPKTKEFIQEYCNHLELSPSITSLQSDDRYLYAAVRNQVVIIAKERQVVVGKFQTNAQGYVFDIKFDAHHRLWIATYAGLECWQQTHDGWKHLFLFTEESKPPHKLSTNMLHNIYSNTDANELVITSAKGIHRVMLSPLGEVNRIITYVARENDNKTLSSNYLWPIRKGKNHTYWVGTLGNGLNKVTFLDKEGVYTYEAESYDAKAGALSGDVESIEVDTFGNIWCGGYHLSYFDDSVKRYRVFNANSGLQSHIFGTSSSCQDAFGNLYFGGAHGVNYFSPSSEKNQTIPPVYFSRYRNNQTIHNDIEFTKRIELYYPNTNFSVDFTNLSYDKEPLRYRYKIEGIDTEWQYTEGKPTVAYQKMPFGNHTLLVEAGNWHSWSGVPYQLTIVSHPPMWLSWAAYLLYVCIALLLLYIGIRYFIRWTQMKHIIAIQKEREQQKEEMIQMKMQFFTDVSHEFRTPLTMIGHAITEINEEPKETHKYINIIKRNTGKLSNMVNELLDFHKIDLHSPIMKVSYADVSSFISDIYDEFKEWAHSSHIITQLKLPEEPIKMWIDQRYLGKIISNILSNSIRYSKKNSSIEMEVTKGTLHSVTTKYKNHFRNTQAMIEGKQLIIKVSDTGIGIDKEELPKIFDRFYRGNKQYRKRLGSGIGLSLVKSLMEAHKGGVIISSEKHIGTELILLFPMTEEYLTPSDKIQKSDFVIKEYLSDYAVEYENHTEEELLLPLKGTDMPTILLVDDNHEVLMMLRDIFVKDYNVLTAYNGQEALEKCNLHFPDLIISDVMMPKMDGLELCSILKKQLHTCFIPIILLTAKAQIENQIEGIEIGADAYLSKPFNTKLLNATVRNLIHKNETIKESNFRPKLETHKHEEYLSKIEKLVIDNLTNYKFSVDHLSMELGWNRTKLYNYVKTSTGMTLANYIRKIRLDKAAKLLRNSDKRISEVCYEVGIDSPSYFTRAFKEQFGVSPSEYAKKV